MVSSVHESNAQKRNIPRGTFATAPTRFTSLLAVILFTTDVSMFLVAAYIAGALVNGDWGLREAGNRILHSSIIFIAFWTIIFTALGLYKRSLALSFKDEFYFTLIALLFGVVPQMLVFTIFPALSSSRLVLVLSAMLAIVFVGTSRSIVHVVRVAHRKRYPTRILIVGTMPSVREVMKQLTRGESDNVVVSVLYSDQTSPLVDESSVVRIWLDTALSKSCEQVILTELQDSERVRQFLVLCEDSGVKLTLALPNLSVATYDLQVERKGQQNLLVPLRPSITRPTSRLIKRLFDVVFGLLIGVCSLPIMAIAALAIYLESGMPIFFKQERIGRLGFPFSIVKFRTMRVDADETWALPGDRRITRVGSILRRTSIDELPQFWNVLKGEMSIVGPRPEMREFEQMFSRTIAGYVERRHALPGITGWAQVNMKRNLSSDDMEAVTTYDLFYVRHWSIFLDFTVLLKTAAEFLFHRAV